MHTQRSNPTDVSDQPFGDAETRLGAMNRAKAAYDAACSEVDNKNEHPDFSVGLEGGLEKQSDELWCMAWMAIFGSQSATCIAAKAEGDNFSSHDYEKKTSKSWGFAKTGSFLLPPALCDLVINERMELGDADDVVFKRVNSKHGQGTVGKLTNGQIDRTNYYVHALKLALIPWVRPELYHR
jgi:non-canonical (house-cleaning) NTP pyrophosphatase